MRGPPALPSQVLGFQLGQVYNHLSLDCVTRYAHMNIPGLAQTLPAQFSLARHITLFIFFPVFSAVFCWNSHSPVKLQVGKQATSKSHLCVYGIGVCGRRQKGLTCHSKLHVAHCPSCQARPQLRGQITSDRWMHNHLHNWFVETAKFTQWVFFGKNFNLFSPSVNCFFWNPEKIYSYI